MGDSNRREYAGTVYKNPDGTYSYTEPRPGPEGGSTSDNGVIDWMRENPKRPPACTFHSHWDNPLGSQNEQFSQEDRGNANALCQGWGICIPNYLLTPSGAAKKYDPTTGSATTYDPFAWSWKR